MSIKSESKMSCEEDVESGQCSDDEIRIIKTEKRSRKHKKKDKQRKGRRRKHSNSSSSARSQTEFFNPYSVNPGKFTCKSECFEMMPEDQLDSNALEMTTNGIISETFNNLSAIECNESSNHLSTESNTMPQIVVNEEKSKNSAKNDHLQEIIKKREFEYRIDISGIDTVTSDLYHYLLDLGLSQKLSNELLNVYRKETEQHNEVQEVVKANDDDDDGYEEEMINDIPVIDQGTNADQYCGYSPEHVSDVVQSYKQQKQPSVSYANNFLNNDYSKTLIDPLAIPDVGPRDPRLNQTKILLQGKQNPPSKLNDSVTEKLPSKSDIIPAIVKEWEDVVTDVVETHLKLYLQHNDINEEEYRSILKRAVNKILLSGEKKLETDKIAKFLHSYVTMTLKSRSLNNI